MAALCTSLDQDRAINDAEDTFKALLEIIEDLSSRLDKANKELSANCLGEF